MNVIHPHHDMTIVINTCDAYSDVLEIFFYALNDYWPDCPFSVLINTEAKTYDYSARVHNHVSPNGKDDWGARLLSTLESVDSEFVLMLYDDFILNAPVNNQRIFSALHKIQSETKAVVVYLVDTALPKSTMSTDEVFVTLKDREDYRLNSAPAIWRKQTLMDYTKAGDTPWAWEVFGTYRTWGDGNLFYTLNKKQEDIYHYNHSKGGAIYRGKWVSEVVEQVTNKYPLEIDWNQRGFSTNTGFEKRSFMWKFRFMQTGFRMVGWKSLNYITSYIRNKIYAD